MLNGDLVRMHFLLHPKNVNGRGEAEGCFHLCLSSPDTSNSLSEWHVLDARPTRSVSLHLNKMGALLNTVI